MISGGVAFLNTHHLFFNPIIHIRIVEYSQTPNNILQKIAKPISKYYDIFQYNGKIVIMVVIFS